MEEKRGRDSGRERGRERGYCRIGFRAVREPRRNEGRDLSKKGGPVTPRKQHRKDEQIAFNILHHYF